MKKDPSAKILGITIAVLLTILCGGLIMLAILSQKPGEPSFYRDKSQVAQKLYDKIMSVDLKNSYPSSPEDVMSLYCDTLNILYGRMLINQVYIEDVITQQRYLLGDILLDLNSQEVQSQKLSESLEILYSKNINSISLEQKAPIYNDLDPKKCSVRVSHYFSGAPTEYMLYHLEKDVNNKWKIINWEPTDAMFQPYE